MSSWLGLRWTSLSMSRVSIIINTNSCRRLQTGVPRLKRREPLRKLVWLPRAPSKVFQIQEKVYLPRDEQDQVDHLNFTYESELMSIRQYCRDNFYLPSRSAGGLTAEQVQQIEDEHERLLRENEEENKRVAVERDRREATERKKRAQELLGQQLNIEVRDEEIQKQAKQIVSKEVDRSKTFITKETLLGAIEEALANPVSYEYAIDKRGNVYTDGKIHPNAFTPGEIPDTSENLMLDDKGDHKFKAKRIFVPKQFSQPDSI